MAAARGFRNVRNDYGLFSENWDEDPSILTPVDPSPISPTGGFHVLANPYAACRDVAFFSPSVNPFHVVLVEYDDGDVIVAGGTTTPDLFYPHIDAIDDPKISRAWAKISTGTIVDELTVAEIGVIGFRGAYNELSYVTAILDGHGWTGWTPALVP